MSPQRAQRRRFQGSPEQMYHSLVKVLGGLPPETLVYCGAPAAAWTRGLWAVVCQDAWSAARLPRMMGLLCMAPKQFLQGCARA